MKRIFYFLLMSLSLSTLASAQVTQFSSNTSLELLAPLGSGKALLLESGMNRLWVTDATSGGTFKLTDTLMYDGAGGLLNGRYVFAATSASFGSEL